MSDGQVQTNSEPLKYSLDFETYLNNLFNSAAGQRSALKKLDNGQYVVEYENDPTAEPICNVTGGLHLVNNLRLIMNRHAAFGDLDRDEIAHVTGNIIRATINPMFVWTELYGIRSLSSLDNFGLNLFESVYTFLTSVKEGGIRNFGASISAVQYRPKENEAQEKKTIY